MFSDLSSASRVWAVFATKPRKEAPALAFLEREGFEAYCPRFLGRRRPDVQPLFPGYIFIWLSPKVELPTVSFFPCIARPLTFGEQVACVEDDLVKLWKEREGGRGYLTPDSPSAFAVGQRVRFKEGVFSGMEGTVIANLPARERVKVLLHHLGIEMPVEADRSVLG
jgi:transcriptional antiterminator RfaH